MAIRDMTLEDCDERSPEVRELLNNILVEHRPDLIRGDMKILLKFADGEHPGTPIFRYRGIVGEAKTFWRKEGRFHIEIIIDRHRWNRMTEHRRRATLHRELCRIAPWKGKRDNDGNPVFDRKKADYDLEIFNDILKLYGLDSLDGMVMRKISQDHRQLKMDF